MTDTTHGDAESVRLTADMVVFAFADLRWHVLLIRRGGDPFAGCLALPGGHVDTGESLEAAARRELTEETGLTVDRVEAVGVYAAPGRDPRGRYVTAAYTTLIGGLPELAAADDAAAALWVPRSTLGAHVLAFDHARIITDAWAGPTCSPATGCQGVRG